MAIETESVFIGERTGLKALIRSGEVDAAGDTALAVRSPIRIFVEAHLGKILLMVALAVFAWACYVDDFDSVAVRCKAIGGKKLYGECWVPARKQQ